MKHAYYIMVCLTVGLLLGSLSAQAGPYVPQGPFVVAAPGAGVPMPPTVPGKEYSEDLTPFTHLPGDKNAAGAPDSEQVIAWDGAAGIMDSFDYSGSRDDTEREVDALAHSWDLLYKPVTGNTSALLFSVDDETRAAGAVAPFSSPNIFYEPIGGAPPAPAAPGGPVWAKPGQIDQHGVTDLDGLEIWGTEPDPPRHTDDSNRYSLYGDPGVAGAGRVSVWAYNSAAHTSIPFIWAGQLAGAIAPNDFDLAALIDLDAMMVLDVDDDSEFGAGDSIMFSIAPVQTPFNNFDGGEIWVWNSGAPAAGFLNHGGHLWNTAFNVQGIFGVDSENINALEAASVPEPGTLVLLGFGGLALGGWTLVRRRRRSS